MRLSDTSRQLVGLTITLVTMSVLLLAMMSLAAWA